MVGRMILILSRGVTMARKAVQGYTEKSFYDNTRYLGIISTLDPQNEGYFRHMVNFDVSDTGQSVTPRKGFLTTTLEGVSLSDSTIVFFQKDIQKYVVFDPLNDRVYISSLSLDGTYLNVENVETHVNWTPLIEGLISTDTDTLEAYQGLLDDAKVEYRLQSSFCKRLIPLSSSDYENSTNKFRRINSSYSFDPGPFIQQFFNETFVDDSGRTGAHNDWALPAYFKILGRDGTTYYFSIVWDNNALHSYVLTNMYQHVRRYLSMAFENPKTIVDSFGVFKQVTATLYGEQEQHYIYLELYYRDAEKVINGVTYPANTLEINLVKTREHTTYDPTQRNIACAKSIIPPVMQNVYTESNRPDGHVSSVGQFLYLKDVDDNYAIQYVYPNKNYTIIPYFDLSPASQVINAVDAAWAFRYEIISTSKYKNNVDQETAMSSSWYDLTTKQPLLDNSALKNYNGFRTYLNETPADQRHHKGITKVINVVPKKSPITERPIVIHRYVNTPYDPAAQINQFAVENYNVGSNTLQDTWETALDGTVHDLPSLIKAIEKLQETALFYVTDLQDTSLEDATNPFDSQRIVSHAHINLNSLDDEEYNRMFLDGSRLIENIKTQRWFTRNDVTGVPGVMFTLLTCTERAPVVFEEDPDVSLLASANLSGDYVRRLDTGVYIFKASNVSSQTFSFPFTPHSIDSTYTVCIEYSTTDSDKIRIQINNEPAVVLEPKGSRFVSYTKSVTAMSLDPIQINLIIPANSGTIRVREITYRRTAVEVSAWNTYSAIKPYMALFSTTLASTMYINDMNREASDPDNLPYDFYTTGHEAEVYSFIIYNPVYDSLVFNDNLIQINTDNLRDQYPEEFFKEGYQVIFYFYPYDKSLINPSEHVKSYREMLTWSLTPYMTSTQVFYGYDPLTVSYIEQVLDKEPGEIHDPDGFMVYDNSRLVVWKGNSVYLSEPGKYEYFKKDNHKIFNERVVKVIQFKQILLVFTVQNLYAIYEMEIQKNIPGNDGKDVVVSERMWLTQTVLYNIMASNKYADAIQVFNQMVLFYSEDGQMFLIKPSTQIDDQTRFSLQYFNKAANDILLNYADYMNERLANYNIAERITKEDVTIRALLSVNTIKIFYCAPGYITYILLYDVLNNRYTVYDSLTFTNIKDIVMIPDSEVYLTTQNKKLYMTRYYVLPNEMDNYVDMSYVNNFKRIAISALLDTGNLNLNNHLQKRFRDLQVVFKNLSTSGILFNVETTIDDIVVRPYYTAQLEVQDVDGTKYLVSVPKSNHNDLLDLVDISQVSEVATSAFQYAINNNLFEEQNVLMDFEGYTSSKLLTHRTSILGLGKVFRLKLQFLSKGKYKIQSFGIVYKERRL